MEFNIFFWIGISLTGIIITVILLMLRVSRIEKYLSDFEQDKKMKQEYKGKSSIWHTTIWGIPYWLWLPITSFIFILIFAFIVYKFLNLTGVIK